MQKQSPVTVLVLSFPHLFYFEEVSVAVDFVKNLTNPRLLLSLVRLCQVVVVSYSWTIRSHCFGTYFFQKQPSQEELRRVLADCLATSGRETLLDQRVTFCETRSQLSGAPHLNCLYRGCLAVHDSDERFLCVFVLLSGLIPSLFFFRNSLNFSISAFLLCCGGKGTSADKT